MFSSPSSPSATDEVWKAQIDQFMAANATELAALAWEFYGQAPDHTDSIGIDLLPRPHFVTCSHDALNSLNQKVGEQLQEMLGIRDSYDPNKEVFMLVIGEGQLKLIYFEADPPPPERFAQLGLSLEELQAKLEADLAERFPPDQT